MCDWVIGGSIDSSSRLVHPGQHDPTGDADALQDRPEQVGGDIKGSPVGGGSYPDGMHRIV